MLIVSQIAHLVDTLSKDRPLPWSRANNSLAVAAHALGLRNRRSANSHRGSPATHIFNWRPNHPFVWTLPSTQATALLEAVSRILTVNRAESP